jgi:hypothetical protein
VPGAWRALGRGERWDVVSNVVVEDNVVEDEDKVPDVSSVPLYLPSKQLQNALTLEKGKRGSTSCCR